MARIAQNRVHELTFTSTNSADPTQAVELDLIVTDPNEHQCQVPAFWGGGAIWRARYASPVVGTYTYKTRCSDAADTGLHNQTGTFEVIAYEGDNPLYRHGKLRVSPNTKHLEHVDGIPFFWLGDTWWLGFTKRLHWPEEFDILTKDRVQKGFTLIQIIAGLYPDMPPFDERGANEAGFPWDPKFQAINPPYFDMVDRRVQHLVDNGLVPCIVGFWGYFIDVAGVPALKKHWRYLIARYGAYPVVWCIAGEAMMPYYLDRIVQKIWKKVEAPRRRAVWSEVTGYVRAIDGFHNPITIHPTRYGHEQLDNPELLDVNMLQTGHANPTNEIATINNTVKYIASARKHNIPVVVGEVCYEGILEANRQEIQRCLFWANLLSGGAGHTYGANGIWQLNRRDQSYGVSPHGASWGEMPWEEAYQLLGSKHVGVGKAILSQYPWWKLQPHPEWVHGDLTFAAGIPRQLRIIYRFISGKISVRKLERGVTYSAKWIDPKNGTQYPIGQITRDKKGTWRTPNPHIFQDWILLLEDTQIQSE